MDALCRLCMADGADLIPVLDRNHKINESNVASYEDVVKKIEYCLDLTVSQDDGLSKTICRSCLDSLNKFCEFKRKSKNAQVFLKKYKIPGPVLNNVKNESTSPKKTVVAPSLDIKIKQSGSPVEAAPKVSDSESTPVLLVEVRNEAQFECNTCGQMFRSELAKEEHCRISHAPKSITRCEICSKVCKNINGLKTHMHRVHLGSKSNKNSEISDQSSSESPTRRSRSRSCSASTERSQDSIQQEDAEVNKSTSPPKLADKQQDTARGISDNNKEFGLKHARIVLERLDVSTINAYVTKETVERSLVANDCTDEFGPPPVLSPIKIRPNEGEIVNDIISKESDLEIEEIEVPVPSTVRTRKKTIVYDFDEEDEDFDPDDPDDPPYAPLDTSTKDDYMVDVEVEEMDHDSFASDLATEIITAKKSNEIKASDVNVTSIITTHVTSLVTSPPVTSTCSLSSTITSKEQTLSGSPSNICVMNINKRKADDLEFLLCHRILIFNLRMSDQTELPYRANISFSEKASSLNKPVVKVVQKDSAKDDPGGVDMGNTFKNMLEEPQQLWFSQLFTIYFSEECPALEQLEKEHNSNISGLTPTVLNQAKENSADSANVPYIRVKNAKELGIGSPPHVSPRWPHDYENTTQNEHTYTSL